MKKSSVALIVFAAPVVILGGLAFTALCRSSGATVTNRSGHPITVHVAFGSDSVVKSWPFCAGAENSCKFDLEDRDTRALPTGGKYLNATLSFGGPVACGKTKVELNLANPAWYDIVDISLVDGFDQKVGVSVRDSSGSYELGPVRSATGNEKAFGVYPDGCDICVDRQKPPCGQPVGSSGCKTGTQYDPDVPCQYQGTTKGGGSTVAITLL